MPIDKETLRLEIKRLQLQEFVPDAVYYEVQVVMPDEKTVRWSAFTHWAGFSKKTSNQPIRELREISPIDPEKSRRLLTEVGTPPVVVNTVADLLLFRMMGGYAIIEKSLCENYLPHVCKIDKAAKSYTCLGFDSLSSKPHDAVWKRKAEGELRKTILKRDAYECQRCHASVTAEKSATLTAHHIFPWSKGGLTEEDNLITLCLACNAEIEDRYDFSLYELIGADPYSVQDDWLREYLDGMDRYSTRMQECFRRELPFLFVDENEEGSDS